MRTRAFTLLLFLFAASLALAQKPAAKATPPPVLPPGPLIGRAPDFSQWTITVKASSEKLKAGEKAPPDQGDMQVSVTKTKPIYHLQMINGVGWKTEKWSIGEVQISIVPNAQHPILSTADSKDSLFTDYSRGDFSGFDWLSKTNFADIKTVGGVDYLIFRDKIKVSEGLSVAENPSQLPTETAEAEAWVNSTTRLPVYLKVGEAATSFAFGPPPSAILVPPADVQAMIDNLHKRQSAAARMPPP